MPTSLDDEMAARWAAFPVAASPRPIVLLGSAVHVGRGFVDEAAKDAWMDGAIAADVPMPRGLMARLPAPRPRRVITAPRVLRVTEVRPVTAAFACDRGPRDLPAYELRMTGLLDPCTVLDPDVTCWWPVGRHEGQGGSATIEDDGVTLNFPASGGVLTTFHRAEFEEHDTYVVGKAITSEREVPPKTMIVLCGVDRAVTGRLSAPLGDRVLVDRQGQPLAVTRDGRVSVSW